MGVAAKTVKPIIVAYGAINKPSSEQRVERIQSTRPVYHCRKPIVIFCGTTDLPMVE